MKGCRPWKLHLCCRCSSGPGCADRARCSMKVGRMPAMKLKAARHE